MYVILKWYHPIAVVQNVTRCNICIMVYVLQTTLTRLWISWTEQCLVTSSLEPRRTWPTLPTQRDDTWPTPRDLHHRRRRRPRPRYLQMYVHHFISYIHHYSWTLGLICNLSCSDIPKYFWIIYIHVSRCVNYPPESNSIWYLSYSSMTFFTTKDSATPLLKKRLFKIDILECFQLWEVISSVFFKIKSNKNIQMSKAYRIRFIRLHSASPSHALLLPWWDWNTCTLSLTPTPET